MLRAQTAVILIGLIACWTGARADELPSFPLVVPKIPEDPPNLTRSEVENIVHRMLQAQAERTKAIDERASPQEYKVGSQVNFQTFWQNGLRFETVDKAFRMHVGGLLHTEAGGWNADDQVSYGVGGVGPLNDGAMFRRARLHVLGAMYETVDWTLEVGFENRLPQFFNAYAELPQLPYLGTFRVGHFREPFGMDALTSYNNLTFFERSLMLDALVPFFNMGMMLYGPLGTDDVTFASGVFRTNSDAFNAADFGDGSCSFTNRLTWNPWFEADGAYALHFGAAHSYRVLPRLDPAGNPVPAGGVRGEVFSARPEYRLNAPRFLNTSFIPADRDNRVGAEFGASLGPILLQAEYMAALVDGSAPVNRSLFFQGWSMQASWFLTGESRPYVRKEGVFGQVRPNENFYWVRGGADQKGAPIFARGAWEIAVRYSQLDLDNRGIDGGNLRDLTFGLNWYLNPNCRVLWNYLMIWRDAAGRTSDGLAQTFGARFQLEF